MYAEGLNAQGMNEGMARYRHVRFIGYAIPTTPADMVSVGDPNGTGSVAGTYRAASEFDDDVAGRIAMLKSAVDTARAALPDDDDPVLNIFVAPSSTGTARWGRTSTLPVSRIPPR